jgi:hypothetical protein
MALHVQDSVAKGRQIPQTVFNLQAAGCIEHTNEPHWEEGRAPGSSDQLRSEHGPEAIPWTCANHQVGLIPWRSPEIQLQALFIINQPVDAQEARQTGKVRPI